MILSWYMPIMPKTFYMKSANFSVDKDLFDSILFS